MSLDRTSFFYCCFFSAAILPLLVSLLQSLLKAKSHRFLCSMVGSKVPLVVFHIELKTGNWQHFHSSLLQPHMELQAHVEPSPPSTTGCKPSTTTTTKNRYSQKLIPANLFKNDHSWKLVPAKTRNLHKLLPLRYIKWWIALGMIL